MFVADNDIELVIIVGRILYRHRSAHCRESPSMMHLHGSGEDNLTDNPRTTTCQWLAPIEHTIATFQQGFSRVLNEINAK
jgi:hypothetical protein